MKTRVCPDCSKRKKLEAFNRDKNRLLGRSYVCKLCAVKRVKAWTLKNKQRVAATGQRWRENNRDKQRASSRKYYKHNNARIRARTNAKRAADPEQRDKDRWSGIKRNYGLSKDQWLLLFAAQGNRCACCGSIAPRSKNGWHTDHDHVTNKLRGIVCHPCNVMLGAARDSVEILEAGKRYLQHADSQTDS